MVHVTVGAMSRSTQLSGLGNHALVRWSKRTPCTSMRDGLRVALLAGCSACAFHVHGMYHSSHLSCWPVCVWTSAACRCSDVMAYTHGLHMDDHDIKRTHATWHTHGIHMAYRCHTHAKHMSYTCHTRLRSHTHVSYVPYTCHTHVIHMSCTCHTCVPHVSNTCQTHVIHMSNTCHIHVIHMSYACHIHASHMSYICRIH